MLPMVEYFLIPHSWNSYHMILWNTISPFPANRLDYQRLFGKGTFASLTLREGQVWVWESGRNHTYPALSPRPPNKTKQKQNTGSHLRRMLNNP